MAEPAEQMRNPMAELGKGSNGELVDSLEEVVTMNFATKDNTLLESLNPPFNSRYRLFHLEPSILVRTPIATGTRPADVYVLDLLDFPVDDYRMLIEKIKQIRAVNIESKVMVLATDTHQTQEEFRGIGEAKDNGLVEVFTRPNPYAIESWYENSIQAMVRTLPDFVDRYRKVNGKFEDVEVVKIGGSIFDLYSDDPSALPRLLGAIVDIHQTQDLILTVGGGPLMEIPSDFRASYNLSDRRFQESSRSQITQQALNVVDLLGQIKQGVVAYIPPEFVVSALRDGWITREFLRDKIPVFSYLPEDSVQIGIQAPPYNASDAHAVMFADYLGAKKIIFAKHTDGIFTRDPRLPRNFLDNVREQFRGRPQFLDFVYAQNIEHQIERIGLNQRRQPTPEHLIETAALQPFIQSQIYTIQVVNGTKPNALFDAMGGTKVGSYIIK